MIPVVAIIFAGFGYAMIRRSATQVELAQLPETPTASQDQISGGQGTSPESPLSLRPQRYPDPVPAELVTGPSIELASGESKIIISTIPALADVEVRLDNQTALTDANGVVAFATSDTSDLDDRISSARTEFQQGEDLRATFTRLRRIASNHYSMAFDIHRPLSFSFVGVNGEIVDTERIGSTTLKNSLGGVTPDIDLTEPLWVFSERVVSTQRGPELRDIEWSVESVTVRDTNVVNRAQIRFFPREREHIEIPVLFFSANFKVTDMFFGFPTGDIIELTYPDGDVLFHELDQDGTLELASLPRGDYHVMIDGSGPRIARPVVLSRNQQVELDMLSWLDIALVGFTGLFFMTVPVFLGRRSRWRDERNLGFVQKTVDHETSGRPTSRPEEVGLEGDPNLNPDTLPTPVAEEVWDELLSIIAGPSGSSTPSGRAND